MSENTPAMQGIAIDLLRHIEQSQHLFIDRNGD